MLRKWYPVLGWVGCWMAGGHPEGILQRLGGQGTTRGEEWRWKCAYSPGHLTKNMPQSSVGKWKYVAWVLEPVLLPNALCWACSILSLAPQSVMRSTVFLRSFKDPSSYDILLNNISKQLSSIACPVPVSSSTCLFSGLSQNDGRDEHRDRASLIVALSAWREGTSPVSSHLPDPLWRLSPSCLLQRAPSTVATANSWACRCFARAQLPFFKQTKDM